jgi:hypothetical protein
MITLTTNRAAAKPPPERTYRIRKDAEMAAVMAIGPHARPGFEFEAYKCDGVWRWKAFDEVRPPTAADLKTSGGKKSIMTQPQGTAKAKVNKRGNIEPHDLDIPPFLKRAPASQPRTPALAKASTASQEPQDAPNDPNGTRTAPKTAKLTSGTPTKMVKVSRGRSRVVK